MNFKKKIRILFKYVLPKPSRGFNLILIYVSKFLKLPRVLGKPITAMIEPTNYCNIKCPLCPTGEGLICREPENLKFDDFKKILDNIGSSIIHLRLWNWGEPLLNNDLPRMIRYAKSKRMFVNTSTNSSFLKDDILEKLVDSGLDQLIVSLDGASPETYDTYRKNGDFQTVVINLRMIDLIKSEKNTQYPEVKLQFIIMKHNEHEIQKVIDLARDCGVDTLFLKTVGVMDPRLKDKIKDYLPTNLKYRRYALQGSEIKKVPLSGKVCDYLWSEVTVNVDGTIIPCCRDAQGKYNCGNLKRTPLSKLWNSKKLISFRQSILKDKDSIEMCKTCSGSNKEFTIMEINLKNETR